MAMGDGCMTTPPRSNRTARGSAEESGEGEDEDEDEGVEREAVAREAVVWREEEDGL
jgi:hypothetical protein